MSTTITRFIRGYEKRGESLITEIPLNGISLETLQDLFGYEKDNPMYDCYPLRQEYLPFFERYVGNRLETNSCDYFLECELM
jgi:hypothetical protein